MEQREMTTEEVNAMVRIKEQSRSYVQDNMGIWGTPFASINTEVKRWYEIQAGRLPRPKVNLDFTLDIYPR